MQGWHYFIIWEWLPAARRWGVRFSQMVQHAPQHCGTSPIAIDPSFFSTPPYKIFETYWWDGVKWSQCDPTEAPGPTRNW